MRRILKRWAGVTLTEVAVAVLLGSIVLAGAFRMLSSGMKTSTKGAAHLTNVQSTSILMAQIEDDLQRAVDVSDMSPGASEVSAKIKIIETLSAIPAPVSIIYDRAQNGRGMLRKRDAGAGPIEHPYARDVLVIDSRFTRVDLPDQRIGFHVRLKTGTWPDGKEVFELERFVLCRNHASNSRVLGWQEP
jgi:type II secretory pathway component PulJ